MKLLSILSAVLLVVGGGFMLLRPATPIDSYFVWLDWDYNAPAEMVDHYTLYLGEWPNIYTAKQKLGYQNSIRVLKAGHNHIYARVSATNSVGESPLSNEVHITYP